MGADDPNSVPMMRIEEPERVFDREKVLGRDAASVFPTMAQENADKVVSATQAVVGSMSFVTESELAEIKAKRGGALRPEDGTMEPEKPLWQVLQEAKDAKEEAFQEGWKTMKQGIYKPVDEEEVEFLDEVADRRREEEQRLKQREQDEAEAFRLMRENRVVKKAVAPTTEAIKRGADPLAQSVAKKSKSSGPAVVVVKRAKPAPKKGKQREKEEDSDDEGGGLGLLGDYGSDSD